MRDSGQVIRKGFYDALFEQVINPDGGPNTIPVVDEKLNALISEHDIYILIGQQIETPTNTKSYWASEINIDLTVVNRRNSTATKTKVENVAGQILDILYPSKLTYGFTIDTNFKLSYSRLENAQYNFTPIDGGFEISKQLTFKTRITQ